MDFDQRFPQNTTEASAEELVAAYNRKIASSASPKDIADLQNDIAKGMAARTDEESKAIAKKLSPKKEKAEQFRPNTEFKSDIPNSYFVWYIHLDSGNTFKGYSKSIHSNETLDKNHCMREALKRMYRKGYVWKPTERKHFATGITICKNVTNADPIPLVRFGKHKLEMYPDGITNQYIDYDLLEEFAEDFYKNVLYKKDNFKHMKGLRKCFKNVFHLENKRFETLEQLNKYVNIVLKEFPEEKDSAKQFYNDYIQKFL